MVASEASLAGSSGARFGNCAVPLAGVGNLAVPLAGVGNTAVGGEAGLTAVTVEALVLFVAFVSAGVLAVASGVEMVAGVVVPAD